MKKSQHRNDEPTVLPSDCSAIIFKADGNVEMFMPAMKPRDEINAGVFNVMRAAILFGDGDESDELRRVCDDMIQRHKKK